MGDHLVVFVIGYESLLEGVACAGFGLEGKLQGPWWVCPPICRQVG